jgi:hypothetical protein
MEIQPRLCLKTMSGFSHHSAHVSFALRFHRAISKTVLDSSLSHSILLDSWHWHRDFSVAQADGKERTTVVELIKLVNVQPVDQTQNAEKLFSSLPKESPYRTIASQSLATIYIRANRYSDAWKALATSPSEVSCPSLGVSERFAKRARTGEENDP